MIDYVYKKFELVGFFKDSIEDVVCNVIVVVSKSVNNVEWFEVQEIRGYVENGQVVYFQVVVKVGFWVDIQIVLSLSVC